MIQTSKAKKKHKSGRKGKKSKTKRHRLLNGDFAGKVLVDDETHHTS